MNEWISVTRLRLYSPTYVVVYFTVIKLLLTVSAACLHEWCSFRAYYGTLSLVRVAYSSSARTAVSNQRQLRLAVFSLALLCYCAKKRRPYTYANWLLSGYFSTLARGHKNSVCTCYEFPPIVQCRLLQCMCSNCYISCRYSGRHADVVLDDVVCVELTTEGLTCCHWSWTF